MGQYFGGVQYVSDLNIQEFLSICFFMLLVFLYGFFPNIFFQPLEYYCYYIIELKSIILKS